MATPAPAGVNLGALSNVSGIYGGLQRGGVAGDAAASASAAKLAGSSGLFDADTSGYLKGYGQTAGNVLGLYGGIKQGGVTGDLQAANSAYGLATGTSGIPGVNAALGTYNFFKNYQSGDTGGDALRGAQAGAGIGSLIVPGVGTVVGGLIGGAVGAVSSAFGPGKVDPENASFEGYTQAFNKATPQQQKQIVSGLTNPYTPLAGYFDLRSGQLKGSNPIYQTYGRQGEQKFTNDLISRVQTAQQSGVKTPQQMWSQVVQPWINSMGTWQDSNKTAMTGLLQNMTGQIMSGTYKTNFKAVGGDTPWGTSSKLSALPGQSSGVQQAAVANPLNVMRRTALQ